MDIENMLDQFRRSSPEEIQDNLESLAMGVELQSYLKPLTDEERKGLKDDFVKTCIRKGQLEDELEKFKEDHKVRMTPVKQKYAAIIEALKCDAMWIEDDLYLIPDWKSNKMNYFDRFGNLINLRDMTKQEREKKPSA